MRGSDIEKELLDVTSTLVSFATTEDRPEEVEKAYAYIKDFLKDDTVNIEEYEKEGKKSLILYKGSKRKKFRFILLCHIDVVPAKKELFVPKVVDNKLYGRGALDMKAGCAVALMLMKNLKNQDFAVIYTSDEEIGGMNGAKYLVEKGYSAEFVIVLESTNYKIIYERKGALRIIVSAEGKSVHSSVPWEGVNALERLISTYKEVKQGFPVITEESSEDEKYQKSLNLALMKGGDVFNKVPDDAIMYLDVRYSKLDDPKEIISFVEKISKKNNCKIAKSWYTPTLYTDKNNKYLQQLLKISKSELARRYGASDGRYFSTAGIPAIDFGATGKYHHGDDEYVEIPSLKKVYDILEIFLTEQEG
ncbi:M20/M25/M40 family metallo-hydrolase [bacterium]|nr:M20/M25/M40 family metallo-hydrolase [bacterium]